MPLSLSQIANNTADVTVSYSGSELHLTYYPGRVTEEVFSSLKKFDHMGEDDIVAGFAAFNDVLASLIKSWDLYEDDAQQVPYPIDAEKMKKLPISFRIIVLNAIMNNIRPEQVALQTVNSLN